MTRLELIIEKSYQTHSHNTRFKITGLVRRFSSRNRSSSRIHCCYIIIGTEFKLTCFVVQSSALGLKEKKMFVLYSSLRTPDLFLFLEDPGLLINPPNNQLSQKYCPQPHQHFQSLKRHLGQTQLYYNDLSVFMCSEHWLPFSEWLYIYICFVNYKPVP